MDMKDVLALADALNARRDGDKGLQDLLNEVSAAQADIVDRVTKMLGQQTKTPSAKEIADAVATAVSEAMSKAVASIELKPEFEIKMPDAPAAAKPRKGAKVKFDWSPNGMSLQGCDITYY